MPKTEGHFEDQSAYPDVNWEDNSAEIDAGDEYSATGKDKPSFAKKASAEEARESGKRSGAESLTKFEKSQNYIQKLSGDIDWDSIQRKLAERYPDYYGPINFDQLREKIIQMTLEKANKEGAEKARAWFSPERLEAMRAYSLDDSSPHAREIGEMADEVARLQNTEKGDATADGIDEELNDDDEGEDKAPIDEEDKEAKQFLDQKAGDVFKYVYWLDPETQLGDLEISELIYLTSYLKITAIDWKRKGSKGNLTDAKHDHNVVVQALKYQLPNLSRDLMVFEDIESTEAGEDENSKGNAENSIPSEAPGGGEGQSEEENSDRLDNFYKALFSKIAQAENWISDGKTDEAVNCLLEVDSMKMALGLEEDDREILVLGKTAMNLDKCGEKGWALRYLEQAEDKARAAENSEYLLLFIAACYLEMGLSGKAEIIKKGLKEEQSNALLNSLSEALQKENDGSVRSEEKQEDTAPAE